MKKNNSFRHIVFFLLFAFSALFSCTKNYSPSGLNKLLLPRITANGENTFGCIVNGKVWIPNGGGSVPATACNFISPSTVIIQANNVQENESIEINLTNAFSTGYYLLNDSLTTQVVTFKTGNTVFHCDTLISGNLTLIKLDVVNHIIAGTISFDAVNGDQRFDIRVGRFDLAY